MRPRIAIVGMGGLYAKSLTLEQFWANILGAVDTASEPPPGRWALDPAVVFDPRVAQPDRVYSRRGCFVEGFELDASGIELAPELLAQLDPLCLFALHAARQALTAVGSVDRGRTGVVLGNLALPTDGASALAQEILGGAFARAALGTPWPTRQVHPLNRYVTGLPAGVVTRALGLGGGGWTLDAACASSLYALKFAVDELQAHRADAMLAGGISRPDALYTQMGFSQLQALSASGRASPFAAAADGLVVGEGAGVFLLKRLEDAERDGDPILAVLAGIGLSNDREGKLLAPSSEGQLRAMRQAYEQAGWSAQDVDLVECHATGTPVGDAVEFASMQALWGPSGWRRGQCVIGSVKSNVGHALTAAGGAGLLKVLHAFRDRTLPPTANFFEPAPRLEFGAGPFRVLSEPLDWPEPGGRPRRAAISGFGFGGINAHVLLEEYRPAPRTVVPVPSNPAAHEPSIAVVGLSAQVGPWSSREALAQRLFARDLDDVPPQPPQHWWGIQGEGSEGYYLEELRVAFDRFRIPPRELEEMLPQQLLMLDVAADALADMTSRVRDASVDAASRRVRDESHEIQSPASLAPTRRDAASRYEPDGSTTADREDPNRTGVFIGIALDLNTTNFHVRWSLLNRVREWHAQQGGHVTEDQVDAQVRGLRDACGPPLTANRTMGALGSIIASRIAREFRLGGPCFTVSSEETSGLHAVQTAMRLLQQGELDQAIVGAVDFAGDVRAALASQQLHGQPRTFSDGAVALVLKRLDDAQAAGDRIYAVLDGIESSSQGGIDQPAGAARPAAGAGELDLARETQRRLGDLGAASSLAALAHGILCLHHQVWPAQVPRPWLRNHADGRRRLRVTATSITGHCHHVQLREAPGPLGDPSRIIRLESPREGLFALRGDEDRALLAQLAELEAQAEMPVATLARAWSQRSQEGALTLALVARDAAELRQRIQSARKLPETPDASADGVYFSRTPLARTGTLAFVFPGSGSHFAGMGRDLVRAWPEILQAQDAACETLQSQVLPEVFWDRPTLDGVSPRDLILGQVALGTQVSDLLRRLGVEPGAVIGYSLGETAGHVAMGAWRDRDELWRRVTASPLFTRELAGPCEAARRTWGLPEGEAVDWRIGVVALPAAQVRARLRGRPRVYVLMVNTRTETVIGGYGPDVDAFVRELASPWVPLSGISTVHCEVVRALEREYLEFHKLPTSPPAGVQFYSAGHGRRHVLTRDSAAESILRQALQGMDFPALIEQAYDDGARLFVEIGPGGACTRMIDAILGDRPHLARSASIPGGDACSHLVHLLAALLAEGVPVDLAYLYPAPTAANQNSSDPARDLVVPVGGKPFAPLPQALTAAKPSVIPRPAEVVTRPTLPIPEYSPMAANALTLSNPLLRQMTDTAQAQADAHAAYLEFASQLTATFANLANTQMELYQSLSGITEAMPPVRPPVPANVALDRTQCLEFAIGSIGKVLGSAFAEVDGFPTRVRLPDEPLMLVDRILSIRGEPRSLTHGGVVTEHDIHPGAWYLDGERIPTCIAVEAGQADLFLSGYLGIDFHTRGLAVYRLLDAVVTFHRGLPGPGEVIHYDIQIERFFRQGDTHLFRFSFEGTVAGEPLLTMRDGCAGFFSAAELEAGRGIVHTELDLRPRPGVRPADWAPPVPMAVEAYSEAQIECLRRGDLAGCFGPPFAALPLREPMRLPSGRMRLVHRVTRLDPTGGRFGLGQIRAEADIHPDDWFLTCHFIDDRVMPGTLMYECCLHTLRIFLMRMGWVGEHASTVCEPVPGIASRLKCRGQVIESTKVATYEVTLKEIGYRPEPYVIVDALMYADGKAIVEITEMSLRLTGLSREQIEAQWQAPGAPGTPAKPVLFDRASILAFAVGKPSEAFGEPYAVFDQDRVIARLPGPPYQFLDRITSIEHARPFELHAGAVIEAEYDVPPREWYFEANRQPTMPFAVLLEVALQPCGWLAAYLGSALTSPVDLRFRNLGGKAIQHRAVTPDLGTLTTQVKLARVSSSVGMIIQHFDFRMTAGEALVYEGDTYFGFFTREALENQVGLREVQLYRANGAEQARGRSFDFPTSAPYPAAQLRMMDRIDLLAPDGGPHGLGFIEGSKRIDPNEWFFEAHFYQDPVWPGSLGLEAFQQLLKVFAHERWGPCEQFEDIALGQQHEWVYRGQVLPTDKRVTVQAALTEVDDAQRLLRAEGTLTVDGRVIYQMKDFSLRWKGRP